MPVTPRVPFRSGTLGVTNRSWKVCAQFGKANDYSGLLAADANTRLTDQMALECPLCPRRF
jgi:hypothetical protein